MLFNEIFCSAPISKNNLKNRDYFVRIENGYTDNDFSIKIDDNDFNEIGTSVLSIKNNKTIYNDNIDVNSEKRKYAGAGSIMTLGEIITMLENNMEKIERTGSSSYPSWVYPANDWYDILFHDYSINHHMGLNIRGGSEVVQYYASFNWNRDEGMLKTDRLNQFDSNITNNTFTFRTNLTVNLNAGIKLLLNTSASLDKYHGPITDVTQAYQLAFNASPVDYAPTYPADEENDWPHILFGAVNASTTNPYASIQRGYTERSRYSATARAEYIHNLSSLF